MRILIALLFVFGTCVSALAQTVGEPKLAVTDYGKKYWKQTGQRVHIAGFNVHYQTLFSLNNSQRSKNNGRKAVAGSRVVSNIGLGGLTEADVRGTTDAIYNNFVEQLTAAGLTVIDYEMAKDIPYYADHTEIPGGSISQAQAYGYVTVTPTELPTLVPGVKKSGKRKTKFIDPSGKISGDLDQAIVAFVDIYVPFAEDGESGWSRSLGRMTDESKVVIKTNLRVGLPVLAAKGNFAESVGLGQNPGSLPNGIRFAAGKMKVGLGTMAAFSATLKKDLPIEGVMKSEKFKSYARGESHTSTMFSSGVYFLEGQNVEETRSVDYDKEAYLRYVVEAGNIYVDAALAEFLGKAAK